MHTKIFLYSWVLGVVFSQSLNYPTTLSRKSGTDQPSRRALYVPLVIRDINDFYKQYVTSPVHNGYQDNENDETFRYTTPVYVKVPQNQPSTPQESGYRAVPQNPDIAPQENGYRAVPQNQDIAPQENGYRAVPQNPDIAPQENSYSAVPQNPDIAPQENGYRAVPQNPDIAPQENGYRAVPQNQDITPQENGYSTVPQNQDIAPQDNYRYRPLSQSPILVLVKQNYPYQASVDAVSTIAPPSSYHAFSTTTPSDPIPVPVIFDEASTVKPSRPPIGSDYKEDSIPESSTYQETPIPVKVPPNFRYQSSISNYLLPFLEVQRQSEPIPLQIPMKIQENNTSLEADAHPVVLRTSQISAPAGSVDANSVAYITSLLAAHSQKAPQVIIGNSPVTTSTSSRPRMPGEIPLRSDFRTLPRYNYDYSF